MRITCILQVVSLLQLSEFSRYLCRYLWVCLTEVHWSPCVCFFIKSGRFLTISSLNILYDTFSLLLVFSSFVYVCMFNGVTQVSELFTFILFPFCSSNWIISFELSPILLILSFCCSYLLLNPSNEFFSNYCTFILHNFYLIPFYNFSFLFSSFAELLLSCFPWLFAYFFH